MAVNRECRRSEIRRVFASGSCWVVRMLGEYCCGEFDGVGVDRGVCVGVEFGRDAAVVIVGLQCEESVSPVVRNGCWGGRPERDGVGCGLVGEGELLGCEAA